MNKRIAAIVIFLFACIQMNALFAQQSELKFFYFKNADVANAKGKMNAAEDGELFDYKNKLADAANYFLTQGPWSVTFDKSPAASGDLHDYFSEGPYWWPVEDDPDAPYRRKDGQRNPDRFTNHKVSVTIMSQAVSTLSYAAYLLDNKEYADKASEIIRVWFLDSLTKMNPNLNYAQSVRNKAEGRGIGLIEAGRFTRLLEAVNFLRESGFWNAEDHAGLRNWFTQFLLWMKTSPNGIDEKYRMNNHGSWYYAQTAAYSLFLKDYNSFQSALQYIQDTLLVHQLDETGSFPEEEARTLSLHYSEFNLWALSTSASMGSLRGFDIWNHKTVSDVNLLAVFNKLIPFYLEPHNWKKEQIVPFDNSNLFSIAMVSYSLEDSRFYSVHKKLENIKRISLIKADLDPLFLVYCIILSAK
ncbi:MAG: alginate lyase family protein [Bacteroidota bacterium]